MHSAFSVPFPHVGSAASTAGAAAQAAPTAPAAPVSYLNAVALRAGLARVAKLAPGARLSNLRVDARSFNVEAVRPNRDAKEIYFGPTGTMIVDAGPLGDAGIASSQIRPQAIPRLLAAMARQFHVAPDRIDYMVLNTSSGLGPQWIVFAKGPAHPGFAATLDGANLHRLGT
jgi:hypothetical protein